MGFETAQEPVRKRDYSPHPWGDDPLKYCNEQYPGITRGKLFVVNHRLYYALKKAGLVEKLPLRWAYRFRGKSEEELLAFYDDQYPGVSVTRLRNIDSAFLQALQRRGAAEKIPHVGPTPKMWGNDPLGFFNGRYPGMTRTQLALENYELYKELDRQKLLRKNVPLRIKKK